MEVWKYVLENGFIIYGNMENIEELRSTIKSCKFISPNFFVITDPEEQVMFELLNVMSKEGVPYTDVDKNETFSWYNWFMENTELEEFLKKCQK